jgi:hypothetical protein
MGSMLHYVIKYLSHVRQILGITSAVRVLNAGVQSVAEMQIDEIKEMGRTIRRDKKTHTRLCREKSNANVLQTRAPSRSVW